MRVRVASAGTGKTTSLVRRYLELVGDGVPLRRVAGVTFTRAAAAELRARVADGLAEVLAAGSYLGGLYTPPDGLAPFEAAARELGGAQVKTIHGFMVSALRLSAPLLGYDPRFEMVAEQDAAADFVAAAQEHSAQIIGMSALLTTTLPRMAETIAALKDAGLRDSVKVMVGGAPVTQAYADEIGADGYGANAGMAVERAKELVG